MWRTIRSALRTCGPDNASGTETMVETSRSTKLNNPQGTSQQCSMRRFSQHAVRQCSRQIAELQVADNL